MELRGLQGSLGQFYRHITNNFLTSRTTEVPHSLPSKEHPKNPENPRINPQKTPQKRKTPWNTKIIRLTLGVCIDILDF